MRSIKEKVHQLIENLPNDAKYEDILEAFFVQQKIERDINQLENRFHMKK